MSGKTVTTLKSFYIYNDSFGKTEGDEEQKIMYYFPPKVSLDEQLKNVGLSEAIIQFTKTFSKNQCCESLHTKKTRHYYYEPEPHFSMVMVVNVPTTSSVEGTDYCGDEIRDSVFQAVVKLAYQMYKLFHNTFTSSLDACAVSQLKKKLEYFFNKYLPSIQLQHCDVMDVFQGVQFLPLDKQTFLHVHCFINLIEASFSDVESTVFLYNDRLIWSGIEPEDMQIVFQYLVYKLLQKQEKDSTAQSSSYGRYITGPENINTSSNDVGKIPKLFLSYMKPHPANYYLVAYQISNCTICLFIPESITLTMETFRKWDMFLGPRLTKLASEVSCQTSVSPLAGDLVSRFVYFNHMNLATKSTIHLDNQRTGNIAVTPLVLRLVADINVEHIRNAESIYSSAETIFKTTSDYWVVGRLSNSREFYVVVQHKNANLIEINDEVKSVCDKELKSIFFHV